MYGERNQYSSCLGERVVRTDWKKGYGVPSGMMEDALYLDRGLGFLNVGSLQNSTNGTLKICATYSM